MSSNHSRTDDNDIPNDGFEDSRFEQGERVRVVLRSRKNGGTVAEAEGRCTARVTGKDVSREGEEPRRKDLVRLEQIDGYRKPHPSIPGETVEKREAWFAEEALRKQGRDVMDGVSFN